MYLWATFNASRLIQKQGRKEILFEFKNSKTLMIKKNGNLYGNFKEISINKLVAKPLLVFIKRSTRN